jgi:hypothetical protein
VRTLVVAAALSLLAFATDRPATAADTVAAKIGFDLSPFDGRGLYGPPDGLRALDYEFCIPATPATIAEVSSVDPTAAIHPGARGRVGCGPEDALVIGSTHQPGFRDVLHKLASLPYVERIVPCFYE